MLSVLQPNTVLQNRYRIVRPLGRGGMGHVYEAVDVRLNRTIAVKETLVETDELRRAFEREAHLLANLRHPALPNVSDHFSEGDGLFLVMEYIPGDDLGVMLGRRHAAEETTPFEFAQVLAWADQLLDALEYLHAHRPPIIHRDIKPANLKTTAKNQIILLDFGLAKGFAEEMSTITATQQSPQSIVGYTPSYAPVEQIQGAGTDARSDLYALGATLYHLITGIKPPDAVTRLTALVSGAADPLVAPHETARAIDAHVSAALVRAMAINPDKRFSAAAEMRAALRRASDDSAATFAPVQNATATDADADEATLVGASSQADDPTELTVDARAARLTSNARPDAPLQQVVIPFENERDAEQKRRGAVWAGLFTVALLAVIGIGAAAWWYALQGRPAQKPVNVNRPRPVVATPTPMVAQQNANLPPVNQNAQINANVETGQMLAARRELARRNIPFDLATLLQAVAQGDVKTSDLLLTAGINANAPDARGTTALMLAARDGRDHLAQLLLEHDADPDAADQQNTTALMQAAAGGHDDTISILLDDDAQVDLTNNQGESALLLAAKSGHEEAVRQLINRDANINIKDKQGRNALQWAEINDHPKVAELLRRAGAVAP